jgi:hypothetical protein
MGTSGILNDGYDHESVILVTNAMSQLTALFVLIQGF